SLFPLFPVSQERDQLVAPLEDSPKPPPQRVTLTLPALNAARSVLVVASGASKASVVRRILEGQEEPPLPAALVRPSSGRLCWFLDEAAAAELRIPEGRNSGM
ncbi:6PGL phosphogluconolactonase, partial [Formicarius rufipectus]|nr:6PGL phosphogluconolactonase [Formicarius rufipectus]